jgi:hypothetical protein
LLTPEARNSFRLRVATALRLAAPLGPVHDELLQRAVDKALAALGDSAA